MAQPNTAHELTLLDRYWRAANYLSVGQIYLMDNPLLREPLKPEHIKPRLLGHWGTTPGLNFIYAHLNRIIRQRDLNLIYVCGPGHGGPGMVANTWLEGSYSEIYPHIRQDADGMQKLFKQFSFPGGIPSHAAPETPGSINEGGELGYSLSHAFGAVFDNPDLIAPCIIGDGEAETGPLASSWHGIKFLNPQRDGAVLPILHLNGYKIANPTILGRASDDDLRQLFRGYGYEPLFVCGHEPEEMHPLMADTLDRAFSEIAGFQQAARQGSPMKAIPRWPMIILRSPKGWTGPKTVDGKKVEGFWRAHQVPVAACRENEDHCNILENRLRSYQPDDLFDEQGRLKPELQALAPQGELPFAGHPTLGTAHALLEAGWKTNTPGRMVQQCGVGNVVVTIASDGTLAFAAPSATLTPYHDALISTALNSDALDHSQPVTVADMGIRWLLIPMVSAEAVRTVIPDVNDLERLITHASVDGVMPFGPLPSGEAEQYEVRGLLVEHGSLTEDPITGSANACLARYFAAQGKPHNYRVRQGTQVRRQGRVNVAYEGETIWIGGKTVTIVEGSIDVTP